jgi:TIR domain
MSKPVVFLSHSSKDKDLILPIKDLIERKTVNAIKVFMASDGQSIRIGKNWVYEISENLKSCTLMFAFLSTNSVKSGWVYYEAGFAASNDVSVIPIGIVGTNVATIPQPLNFHQGFNLNDINSLKNILSIIKDKYELEYSLDIDENKYSSLPLYNNNNITNFYNIIDYVSIKISGNYGRDNLVGFNNFLSQNGYKLLNTSTGLNGQWGKNGINISVSGGLTYIDITPTAFQFYLDELNQLDSFLSTYMKSYAGMNAKFIIHDSYDCDITFIKISEKIANTNIEYEEYSQGVFSHGSIKFTLLSGGQERKSIRISYSRVGSFTDEVVDLVDQLYLSSVITDK